MCVKLFCTLARALSHIRICETAAVENATHRQQALRALRVAARETPVGTLPQMHTSPPASCAQSPREEHVGRAVLPTLDG